MIIGYAFDTYRQSDTDNPKKGADSKSVQSLKTISYSTRQIGTLSQIHLFLIWKHRILSYAEPQQAHRSTNAKGG